MTHHDIAAFIIEIQWEQMVALQRYYSAVWVGSHFIREKLANIVKQQSESDVTG